MNTSFHFPFDQDNKYYEKLMKGYKNGIETTFEEYLRKQHGVKWVYHDAPYFGSGYIEFDSEAAYSWFLLKL